MATFEICLVISHTSPHLLSSICLSLAPFSFFHSSSSCFFKGANVYISCNRLLCGALKFILQPVVMARFLDKSWQPLVVDFKHVFIRSPLQWCVPPRFPPEDPQGFSPFKRPRRTIWHHALYRPPGGRWTSLWNCEEIQVFEEHAWVTKRHLAFRAQSRSGGNVVQ